MSRANRKRSLRVGLSVAVLVVASAGVACGRSESTPKGRAGRSAGTLPPPATSAASDPSSPSAGTESTSPGAGANPTVARPAGSATVPTTWSDKEKRYYAEAESSMPSDARMVLAGRPKPDVSWRIYVAADRSDKRNPYVYRESRHSQGGGGGYGPLTPPFDVAGGTIQPEHGIWFGIAPSSAARVVAFMGGGGQIESVPFGRDDRYPNLVFFAIVIPRDSTVDRIEAFDASGRSLGSFNPGSNQIIWEYP